MEMSAALFCGPEMSKEFTTIPLVGGSLAEARARVQPTKLTKLRIFDRVKFDASNPLDAKTNRNRPLSQWRMRIKKTCRSSLMMVKLWRLTVFLFLCQASTASNIRSRPHSHAKINIENFKHQQVGNPSVLAFNLFTDDRGEEKNIYSFTASKYKGREFFKLKNFDRDVLTFVGENKDAPERLDAIQQRRDILKQAALDTSADDHGTDEGGIGKFADRSLDDVTASAELHDIQQAPYVDEDDRGVILAKEIMVKRTLHVDGGRYLIVDSSDIKIDAIRQWKMIVDEHFDDHAYGGEAEVTGWIGHSKYHAVEHNKRGHCGVNITPRTNFFLGPYQSCEVTKTFQLPSDHTRLKLTANFHFLDHWNDQVAYLKVNGKMVWQKGHTMCGSLSVIPDFDQGCQTKGVNACGGSGVDRMGERVVYQMEYFSNKIELTWGATLEAAGGAAQSDASWGVDDLEISVL